METPILRTKFYIPQRRANAVPRPDLIERLNLGLSGKLSLISAPAGFGKTTLVIEWLAQLPQDSHRAAWISLDENDNEIIRFITYLIAAVQMIWPDFGSAALASLSAAQTLKVEAITHELLNEWAQNAAPMLLVLDDYHVVEDPAIHQFVNFLIDYAPPHLQFVITSRDIPPLSLPRWRVREQLTEIQAGDLRFSTSETQLFLNQTMGLSLEDAAITTIESQTEGWVAGLQLAAISLRGTQNADIFIDAFTGRDRRIADYLLSEVLARQTSETQQFLLHTSILTRFNASLCAILLEKEDQELEMQQFLADLEATDLFIVPLDNERYWYRYHHLFAQLLRQRLQGTLASEGIARLHLRAAKWYQARQFFDEAIHQAMQAQDFGYAAQLIPQIPLQRLWEPDLGSLFQDWAKQIPADAIREYPLAAIWIMLVHVLRGDINTVQYFLALVKQSPAVEAERKIFESILMRNSGNLEKALQLAQSAAANLTDEEMELKIMAFAQVANCQITVGKIDQAAATLKNVREWLPAGQKTHLNMQLEIRDLQGSVAKIMGDYYQAERIYQESLALVEQAGVIAPQVGMTYYHLGTLHYQWNALDQAEGYFQQASAWGKRTGIFDLLLNTTLGLADLALARGKQEKAREVKERVQNLIQQTNLPFVHTISRAIDASYTLRLGELDAAVRWANASGLSLEDQPDFSRFLEYLIYVAIRLAEIRALGEQSELPELIDFLEWFVHKAQTASHNYNAIRGLIIKALALDLHGETKAAVGDLHRALELAQPGSLLRVFLDQGAPMQQLLEKALSYGEHLVSIRRLLVAFAEEAALSKETQIKTVPPGTLPETLTSREFEILQLIAAGLSNKAIEEKLVISNNTVRTHIKNLYGKLGVNNRTQAVLRARETGLL